MAVQNKPKRPKSKHFFAEILEIIDEAPDVKTFRLERPSDFDFLPGQFIMIFFRELFGNQKRAYSLSSSPLQQDFISITVKLYGLFTHHMWTLREGDQMEIKGPYGHFVLDTSNLRPAVFIAGGVGITPMYSMLQYSLEKKEHRKMLLFYSNRRPKEIVFYRQLLLFEKMNPLFRVVYTLTRLEKEKIDYWPGLTGRFNKDVIREYINDFLPPNENDPPKFYLCGPASMIETDLEYLAELGYPKEDILFEKFW